MFYDASRRCRSGRRSVSLSAAPTPVAKLAALPEVLGVTWVVGVCFPADFDVALDFGAGGLIEGQHLAGALLLGEPDAEEPALARCREVLAHLPAGGLGGVASFGPAPELPMDVMVQPVKGPLGGSVSVVVGPTPDDGVEFAKEHLL